MTVAPASANRDVQNGAATACSTAKTVTPLKRQHRERTLKSQVGAIVFDVERVRRRKARREIVFKPFSAARSNASSRRTMFSSFLPNSTLDARKKDAARSVLLDYAIQPPVNGRI
jgi:hypothetical protein